MYIICKYKYNLLNTYLYLYIQEAQKNVLFTLLSIIKEATFRGHSVYIRVIFIYIKYVHTYIYISIHIYNYKLY